MRKWTENELTPPYEIQPPWNQKILTSTKKIKNPKFQLPLPPFPPNVSGGGGARYEIFT